MQVGGGAHVTTSPASEPRDQLAITPLIWDHRNPHDRFELDMNSRIPVLT